MTEWHGWGIGNGAELHIGRHPYRKSVALMATVPHYGLCVLGYFRSKADATLAQKLIDGLVGWRDADSVLSALAEYRLSVGVKEE